MNAGVSEQLAANVQRFRRHRAWSLSELARRAGLDPGTVGKVEAGGNATLKSLIALADALQVSLEVLLFDGFAGAHAAIEVIRADEQSAVDVGSVLIRHLADVHNPFLVELRHLLLPGGACLESSGHAAGTIERFFVLQGRLQTGLADHLVEVSAGDFVTFRADSRHRYRALDDGASGILLVCRETPPAS